jgi:ubiquinone/menaquinone biosynthesis C-methylase UbiE
MSIRGRFFAATYDRMMTRVEHELLTDLRRELLGGATGDVLEVGGGTGVNIAYYGPRVRSLTMTEPEPPMLRRLQRRADDAGRPVTVLRAPAEDLPFEADSFDTVVSTLVLCGVTDQQRALREAARVLRPGGRLLFIEHVRSDDERSARFQDRMNWMSRLVTQCECNRPTQASIVDAGFVVDQLEHYTMPHAPKFVRPVVAGVAGVPAGVGAHTQHSGTMAE